MRSGAARVEDAEDLTGAGGAVMVRTATSACGNGAGEGPESAAVDGAGTMAEFRIGAPWS